MTNNLSDFQTILWPATKVSNVGFYKKPSAGFTSGQVIEAPFTRAGAGRKVIDASGNLVDAAANVPAWTFPIGGRSAGCAYLSFLPSVENLLTYSEQFDNADWTKVELTISADATTSPDGTTNADKLIPTVTNAAHIIRQTPSVTSGNVYTISYFVKKGEYDFAQLAGSTNFALDYVNFDLTNGVISSSSLSGSNSANIQPIGDYYQISLTATATGTGSGLILLLPLNADIASRAPSFAGDGTSGIFAWGGQFKEGSYISPLDYVKTEASAVTRSVDRITNIADLQGDGYLPSTSEGSVIFNVGYQGDSANAGTQRFALANSSSVNQFAFSVSTAGVRFTSSVGGATIIQDLEQNELQRLILTWNGTAYSVYYNGFKVGDYTATSAIEIARLLSSFTPDIEFDAKMLNFAPTALTANQAEAASSWPSFDLMVSDLGYS